MEKQKLQQRNNSPITDQLNRPLHDLRVSVIDRCNFRCSYCMPNADEDSFLPEEQWLGFADIKRLVEIFVRLGVDKIRLTGGEPLLRPDIVELVRDLRSIRGIKDLALTTNGALLNRHAKHLKKAGLDRITVSLDTLNPQTFLKMNGVKLEPGKILDSIFLCQRLKFKDVKVNAVIQRGVNEEDILRLAEVFRNSKITLRFIEYMGVGTCNKWSIEQVVSSEAIMQTIHKAYPIKALSPNYLGEVATRYEYADGSGEVGFISAVTQPFCQDCSRARLSADGQLYTCLFAQKGTSLKSLLDKDDQEIGKFITGLWNARKDRYSEDRYLGIFEDYPDKVEMFRIGG